MQNAYVGDIGDFGKFTLLENLARSGTMRVGVVWHLVEEVSKAKDGRHRKYLNGSDPHLVRDCNEALFQEFARRGFERHDGHKVSMLEEIYSNFDYFSDVCHRHPDGTFISRRDWISRARTKMKDADLIFFDPDNGISLSSGRIGKKHIHIEELKTIWADGKSLLVYHHLGRTKHEEQINTLNERLAAELERAEIYSFHFRRGTGRAYFLIVQEHHRDAIREGIQGAKSATAAFESTLAGWRSGSRSQSI